jgi:polyisoprenoid-binding protein YceI
MLRKLPSFLPSTRFIKLLAAFAVLQALAVISAPQAEAQEWALDNANSRIIFEGHAGGQLIMGEFKHFQAEIRFDPEEPENAEIAANIEINSMSTGRSDLDTALLAPEWFDTRNYPIATFRGVSLKEVDEGNYELTAEVTIKGHTKRLLLPIQLEITDGEATAHTEAYLDRLDFELGPTEPIAGVLVDRNVRIAVDISAKRLDN